VRRALSEGELRRLIAKAEVRAVESYLAQCPNAHETTLAKLKRKARERSLTYRAAALTGLRENELKTLRWGNVNLAAGQPTLTVDARYAKAKRSDTIPINDELAEELRGWCELRSRELGRALSEDECVFHIPRHLVDHFRRDCQTAGIALEDRVGRIVDFHSLRHTYSTLLSKAGVVPQIA